MEFDEGPNMGYYSILGTYFCTLLYCIYLHLYFRRAVKTKENGTSGEKT